MKIYHKKNFATGLFFTLLGVAFLALMLARWEFSAKSLFWCLLCCFLGPSFLLRSLSREASRQDKIDEEDERTVQVNLRGRSRAFSIVRYTLLGACWLCMAAAVLSGGAPERQLVFGGMSVTAGLIWFVSLLAEVLSCAHYEKRM